MKLLLSDLPPQTPAVILKLSTQEPIIERLFELGFLPGETIVIEKKAPFGDPLEISILNYRLCLRKSQACHIEVQRI